LGRGQDDAEKPAREKRSGEELRWGVSGAT